jgi:hypothetical protein
MIFCINVGLADIPNDDNQSIQDYSSIIDPIFSDNTSNKTNCTVAALPTPPVNLSLKEHRWDSMSG